MPARHGDRCDRDTGLDDPSDLRRRVDEARQSRRGGINGDSDDQSRRPDTALGIGFRIGTEFVSAVVVGGLIGFGIDRLAGTTPWGMVVLFLMGSAAGFLNIYRAAVRMGLMGGDATMVWPGLSAWLRGGSRAGGGTPTRRQDDGRDGGD